MKSSNSLIVQTLLYGSLTVTCFDSILFAHSPSLISSSSLRKLNSQSRNSISGTIFNYQRQPVNDVDVELLDESSRLIAHTRSFGGGRYSFNNLSEGRYRIHVLALATDYEDQTQEYQIINFNTKTSNGSSRISGSDFAQVDFYLKTRKSHDDKNQVTGIVFAQDIPSKAKTSYKKAVMLFEQKDNEKALAFLKDAVSIFPDYYVALERLGLEYFQLKQYENARDYLTKAVGINPRSFDSWYTLAQSEYLLKNFNKAIEASNKSIEIIPNSINAYLILSVSLKENGNYIDAEIKLKKSDEIGKGKNAEVHWQLAKLYADKFQRFSEAADELEVFLKLDPNNSNAERIKKLIQIFRSKATNKIK